MSGQHKTPLLGWHPRSAELDAWVRAEATTRGVPLSDLLDEALRLLHHKLTGIGADMCDERHQVVSLDGWTCDICGQPVNGQTDVDGTPLMRGDSVRHV